MDNRELAIRANEIRKGIIEAVYSGQSGHPGGALSCAELFAFLSAVSAAPSPSAWRKKHRALSA